MFALIDEALQPEASKIRWVSSGLRPVRSRYDVGSKKSAPESLARWVWAQTKGTQPPRYIAHVNADLQDCRSENLKEVGSPHLARSGHTGENVALVLAGFDHDAVSAREERGYSKEGISAKRGKKGSVSKEQIQQLLDARLTVGRDLSLKNFNAEIVSEIVGQQIAPLLLSKILKGKTGRIEGFDYSTIRPFRRR